MEPPCNIARQTVYTLFFRLMIEGSTSLLLPVPVRLLRDFLAFVFISSGQTTSDAGHLQWKRPPGSLISHFVRPWT